MVFYGLVWCASAPSVKHAKDARRAVLVEEDRELLLSIEEKKKEKGKKKDEWLTLLLRERLGMFLHHFPRVYDVLSTSR